MPISEPVVGRLAPSPTGAQHLGNARTYLVAWLAARSQGGKVVMRIEDIDSPRVKPWATQQAIDDLRWLGLDWDEGPDVGGPHGPYIQTERAKTSHDYQNFIQQLVADGRAYPCSCSRRDIEAAASAPHAGHEGTVYPGTCAAWRPGDEVPPADSYCWRFRVRDEHMSFEDLVAGRQTLHPARDLGDFPLTRKTGEAAYQLAVVVDDAAMGVNQVVRGEDLIPSTFRQLELFEALNYRPPAFAHVPLVCGTDGRRLAKRHGDTRLSLFRERGVRATQIVGWAAASIGLIEQAEEVTAAELLSAFSWERLNHTACIVDDQIFIADSGT